MPATTGVYSEQAKRAEGLPHTWRVQYHRPGGAGGAGALARECGRPQLNLDAPCFPGPEIHRIMVQLSQTGILHEHYAGRRLAGEGARFHPAMGSAAPLAKYRYRRRLPHLQRADADLFVTFCTARWKLPFEARDLVLEHCLREGGVLPLAPKTVSPNAGCPILAAFRRVGLAIELISRQGWAARTSIPGANRAV